MLQFVSRVWQFSLRDRVHWRHCLDFPLHRLARFFSISSTRKYDPLRVIVTLVFAENPSLARCFGMICALSQWALHARTLLLNEYFSLKYYKATTFVESSLLGNCSLCFSGLFSSCKELSRTLEFLEKEIHFAFWRYLYFSEFYLQLVDPRQSRCH